MTRAENSSAENDNRVEKVRMLKRELQGPLGLIQKYEAASEDERENYVDSINKAYNDRQVLEKAISKEGTPEGSREFGKFRVAWEVLEPTRLHIHLSEGNEPEQDFEISVEGATTDDSGRQYEIRRFAYHQAKGYLTVYFPRDGDPGVLTINGVSDAGSDVLAVW